MGEPRDKKRTSQLSPPDKPSKAQRHTPRVTIITTRHCGSSTPCHRAARPRQELSGRCSVCLCFLGDLQLPSAHLHGYDGQRASPLQAFTQVRPLATLSPKVKSSINGMGQYVLSTVGERGKKNLMRNIPNPSRHQRGETEAASHGLAMPSEVQTPAASSGTQVPLCTCWGGCIITRLPS